MVTIRQIALPLALALLAVFSSSGRAGSYASDRGDDSLFSQSASEGLERGFPSRDVSYLLLDARTGRQLAARWEHSEAPIPMGSLVKPFAALAYGEQHDFHYPGHTCRGTASGCWLPGGHGIVDLRTAIALSCNSYFRMLVADLSASDVALAATRFGLEPPGDDLAGVELAGLGAHWRTSPLRMARAYLEIARRRREPGASEVVEGMAQSARRGTGAAIHNVLRSADALVKTGTGKCTHLPHAPGDGFAVVLLPADDPRLLLMVRVHGVPGAQAAKIAGEMLRQIGV